MDITERRKNEFHLNYLNSIVEQSSDAIISTDAGMIIKSWNKGAERMYGYTAKEVINQEGAQFMHSILNKDLVKRSLVRFVKPVTGKENHSNTEKTVL